MSGGHEYKFKIDGFTPETIPMARLAEYMADIAAILGEQHSVHFVRVERGSTEVIQTVDYEAVPKVANRVEQVRKGNPPNDAKAPLENINKRLKLDNSTGVLCGHDGAEIIQFPGRNIVEPTVFGPFTQEGSLDGEVIVVGGRADIVPVHIKQGDTVYNCKASRDLAQQLAMHLFESEVRVFGSGRWFREQDGTWTLQSFTIKSFELLENEPLSAVVTRLRKVPGSGWADIDDPWSELIRIRDQKGESH